MNVGSLSRKTQKRCQALVRQKDFIDLNVY